MSLKGNFNTVGEGKEVNGSLSGMEGGGEGSEGSKVEG